MIKMRSYVFLFFTYVLKKLRFFFNFLMFHLKFLILYLSAVLTLFIWPFPILNGRHIDNLRQWGRVFKYLTSVIGVTWELRNGEVLAKDRGAVIVANHQSFLDVVGMSNIWDTISNVTVVVKKEIIYIWPLCLVPYFGRVVFINRKDAKSAYALLDRTSRVIKKKIKIWIFPEGTRNYDYTKFLPFKKGAFIMAVTVQAPIIPVVFSPFYFIDTKNYKFSKDRVIIQCLEEVPTVGLTMDDVPELIERVRSAMWAVYKELSKEVIPATTHLSVNDNVG